MTLPTDGETSPTETTHCRACGGTGEFDSGEESYTCGVCGGVGEHPTDLVYGVTGTAEIPPVHYPERPSLADFLLARIAEDEEAARRAAFGYGAGWTSVSDDVDDWSAVHADGKRDMVGCEDRDVAEHIASHDPARVLAECDAKRRMVVRCDEMLTAAVPMAVHLARQTLADLGRPFASHPDFRPEWTP